VTVLGLDIGGSKTHALLVDGGAVLAEHTVASANIASVGPAAAGAALDALAVALPEGPHTVCAGAAGADSPAGRARLATLLAERFPGARVAVTHDTAIILAAAGLDAGVVLIAGTGSVAWGRRTDGAQARAGGWGYLLGDEGSGYAISREAVRQALAEVDAGGPVGPLTARLLEATGLDRPWRLLDRFYEHPERRYWASLAGLVVAGDDPTSRQITEDAARALAALVATVAARLGDTGPTVLAGGLAVHQPRLSGRVAELLGGDVRVLDRAPAWGAVRLATTMECS
jgi:N-acetylglucosamine kinase-like BadF-type ATPase